MDRQMEGWIDEFLQTDEQDEFRQNRIKKPLPLTTDTRLCGC